MGTLNTHANLYDIVGKQIGWADSYFDLTPDKIKSCNNLDIVYFGTHCVKRNKKGKRVHKI